MQCVCNANLKSRRFWRVQVRNGQKNLCSLEFEDQKRVLQTARILERGVRAGRFSFDLQTNQAERW